MKQVTFIAFLLLFSTHSFSQITNLTQLNSAEFNTQFNPASDILLDVRTINEFKNGHLKNAGQLDYYASGFNKKLLLLPKNQKIFLYCNTGYRSSRAAQFLVQNGFKEVYNLEHGIMEWNLSNFPTIKDADAKKDSENKMETDEFNALINSKKLVFVDFYAPWCAPCRKMMPMIDSLTNKYRTQLKIVKVNADASSALIKNLKIASVPHLVLFYNGKSVFIHNGSISRNELEILFKKHLVK